MVVPSDVALSAYRFQFRLLLDDSFDELGFTAARE